MRDYDIANWGGGYFSKDGGGHITVKACPKSSEVKLIDIVDRACASGLSFPMLIRFTDILQNRVIQVFNAFENVIAKIAYQGHYMLVYPIKVNQEATVVNALVNSSNGYKMGLEAGSKPELMAVLGILSTTPSTIICNGYKDASYIRAALIAQKMGHLVYLVIESFYEIDILIKESQKLDIRPNLGVRIRLQSKVEGKWQDTGGFKSKFGLNSQQILNLIRILKDNQLLNCLNLLHCHLGSQIANIEDIQSAMQEVVHFFVELRHLGAPIQDVDLGGGLAVDYEGTQSQSHCSMNYSIEEYATQILNAFHSICEAHNIPHPNIITESGRALTAHHAVLITNIADVEKHDLNQGFSQTVHHHLFSDIMNTYEIIHQIPPIESYHNALSIYKETLTQFKNGLINLVEKSNIEMVFFNICDALKKILNNDLKAEYALSNKIRQHLAAKVYCNLSFFQSIPDAWAINQIFPISPITHLNEPHDMEAILYDITCDSDGTIQYYAGQDQCQHTIMLPKYHTQDPYYLGFFLVGAYQEILGNLHNLFGDTHSLDVQLGPSGEFHLTDLLSGDTIGQVLRNAHYNTKKLILNYEKLFLKTNLSQENTQLYINELRSLFTHSTYLDI